MLPYYSAHVFVIMDERTIDHYDCNSWCYCSNIEKNMVE